MIDGDYYETSTENKGVKQEDAKDSQSSSKKLKIQIMTIIICIAAILIGAVIILNSYFYSNEGALRPKPEEENEVYVEPEYDSEVESIEYSTGEQIPMVENPDDVAERFEGIDGVIHYDESHMITQEFNPDIDNAAGMAEEFALVCKNCLEQYAELNNLDCAKYEITSEIFEVVPGTEDAYYTFTNGDRKVEVHFTKDSKGELHGYLKEI